MNAQALQTVLLGILLAASGLASASSPENVETEAKSAMCSSWAGSPYADVDAKRVYLRTWELSAGYRLCQFEWQYTSDVASLSGSFTRSHFVLSKPDGAHQLVGSASLTPKWRESHAVILDSIWASVRDLPSGEREALFLEVFVLVTNGGQLDLGPVRVVVSSKRLEGPYLTMSPLPGDPCKSFHALDGRGTETRVEYSSAEVVDGVLAVRAHILIQREMPPLRERQAWSFEFRPEGTVASVMWLRDRWTIDYPRTPFDREGDIPCREQIARPKEEAAPAPEESSR